MDRNESRYQIVELNLRMRSSMGSTLKASSIALSKAICLSSSGVTIIGAPTVRPVIDFAIANGYNVKITQH